MASHAQVAEHLDMSRQNATDLFSRGVLPGGRGQGKADIDECRVAYIRHLRSKAGGGTGDAGADLDLASERARLAKEQADRQEMLNAQMRGELLARPDVDAAVSAAFARVRAKLLSVPGKAAAEVVAVDQPAEAEALIRDAVCEALEELAGTTVADLVAAAGEDE